jgi:Na+/H+ antiporter NhaC
MIAITLIVIRVPICYLIRPGDWLATITALWSSVVAITGKMVRKTIVFLIGTSNGLTTVRAARCLVRQITAFVIRFSINNLELARVQGTATTGAEKMLRVPVRSQSADIIAPHTLPAIVTQRHACSP